MLLNAFDLMICC